MPTHNKALLLGKRLRANYQKLRWGVRVVGVRRSILGAACLVGYRLRRPTSVTVKLASGPILEMDYPKQVVPALIMFGDYIDPEFDFLRLVARPGWTVIDIGAAIGQFTIFAAGLPVDVVHSFEPSSVNIRSLRRNARLNGVENRVIVHQVALADGNSEAVFTTTTNPFMSRLETGVLPSVVTDHSDQVPVRKFSDQAKELGLDSVDCLKINVAGFEPEVLSGCADFLAQQRADFLILLIGEASIPHYCRIAEYGYTFFFFHPRKKLIQKVASFDRRTLSSSPWPARHLIAVSGEAIRAGKLQGLGGPKEYVQS